MPQITYSAQTDLDTERISAFLDGIAPNLADKATLAIIEGIEILKTFPEIAKYYPDEPYTHMRELVIPFGKSAYLVLYEYDKSLDEVIIATIRHAKESGYKI